MAKYLNGTGLARAWEKIKAYVDGVFEDIPTATITSTGMMHYSDKAKLNNLVSTIGATASDGSVYAEDVAYIAATSTKYGGMTVRNIPAVYTCDSTAEPPDSAVLPDSYTIAGSSYTGSTGVFSPASAVGTLYIDVSNRRLVNLCGSTAYYGSTAAKIYTVARPGDIIYHDSHPWLAINEKGDLAEFPTTGASV